MFGYILGEVKDLADQLGEGGKSVVDFEKAKKKLEMEKEELQMNMEVRNAHWLEGEHIDLSLTLTSSASYTDLSN